MDGSILGLNKKGEEFND